MKKIAASKSGVPSSPVQSRPVQSSPVCYQCFGVCCVLHVCTCVILVQQFLQQLAVFTAFSKRDGHTLQLLLLSSDLIIITQGQRVHLHTTDIQKNFKTVYQTAENVSIDLIWPNISVDKTNLHQGL